MPWPSSGRVFPSFVERNGAEHVSKYKYHAGEYTYLDNKMNVFWEATVKHLPKWLAPNIITVIGFGFVIATVLLYFVSTSPPNFDQVPPRWFYLANAVLIFLYQTFDAWDGKQARRLGAASPLGTIMDHGCDIISLPIIAFTTLGFLVSGTGLMPFLMFAIAGQAVQFCFFWMEYHFGVFQSNSGLGVSVGVTEAQDLVILGNLLGFVCGGSVYQMDVLQFLPKQLLNFLPPKYRSISFTSIVIIVMAINNLNIVAITHWRAMKHLYQSSHVNLDRWTATLQIFHNWLFILAEWVYYEIVFMFYPKHFPQWATLMCICGIATLTASYSILILRLLLSSTCRYQYSALQWPAIPFLFFTLYSFIGFQVGYRDLIFFNFFSNYFHFFIAFLAIYYVWQLTDLLISSWYDIADQLGINVWSLEKREDKNNSNGKNKVI